jgi:hypothetical protein
MSDSYDGLGLQKETMISIGDETSEGWHLIDDNSSNGKSDMLEQLSRTSFVRGSSFSATTRTDDPSAIDSSRKNK